MGPEFAYYHVQGSSDGEEGEIHGSSRELYGPELDAIDRFNGDIIDECVTFF